MQDFDSDVMPQLGSVGGYYTVPTLARLYGVRYDAFDARLRRHKVPAFKLGVTRLVRLSDVLARWPLDGAVAVPKEADVKEGGDA
jgi:hypothetical protein